MRETDAGNSPDVPPEFIRLFLEHLRTVTFALVATCLALFASLLAEPIADLKIAKRDLERIRSALQGNELQQRINRAAKSAVQRTGSKSEEHGTYGFMLTYKSDEKPVQEIAPLQDSAGPPIEDRIVAVFVSRDGLTASCGEIHSELNAERLRVALKISSPLSDFWTSWDCLQNLRVAQVNAVKHVDAKPVALPPGYEHLRSPPAELAPMAGTRREAQRQVELSLHVSLFGFDEIGRLAVYVVPRNSRAFERGRLVPERIPQLWTTVRRPLNARLTIVPLHVPLDISIVKTEAQKLIIDDFFQDTAEGPFERRFPQLATWARDRGARNVGILLEDVQHELERSSESFEVLGVKIPLSAIAKVGILVFAAIAAYLCLHLRRLGALLKQQRALPEFPWIGIYRERMAKVIFAITVVGLPIGVSALLLMRSWNSLSEWTIIVPTVLFLFAQGLLIFELRNYWRSWPPISPH